MEQQPVPAELLDYQTVHYDPWVTIVKVAATAGIALGVFGILELLLELGPLFFSTSVSYSFVSNAGQPHSPVIR